jgi:hypothetical protein
MVILELNGRFPPAADLDAAWRKGIDAFRPDSTPDRRGRDARAQRDAVPRSARRARS